jgi:hypothetical protein
MSRKPKRVQELSTRRLSDEETVVLSPTGSAIVLNEIGAVVLDLCDGTRTIDDVANILCDALAGAERARVVQDVQAFVESLVASGCLVDGP